MLQGLHIFSAIGQPSYNYAFDCDLDKVQSKLNLAKERKMVVRLIFDWIMDREQGLTEQVEGVTSCTNGGLVMMLRLLPKFIMNM